MNSKFEPSPMLADRLDVSQDRRTYTFTLRRGVRFHHGNEVTREDARASLERWGRVNVRGRIVFDNVQAIATPDLHTLVVRLREPYALFVSEIGSYHSPAAVYPKEVIDEVAPGAPVRRLDGFPAARECRAGDQADAGSRRVDDRPTGHGLGCARRPARPA